MSALRALVAHSLYRRRWLVLAVCVVLCAFQIFAVAAARSVDTAGGFSALSVLLPNFLREWAGVMMSSFGGLSLFGYSHPVVILLLVAIAITTATEVVDEVESRFVDIVMARPVRRGTPLNRSAIVLLVVMLCCFTSMVLGTLVGLVLFKPATAASPAWRTTASLVGGLAMVVLSWGGIALAIAAVSTRRATAVAAASLLAAAMFILSLLGQFWAAAKPYALVSPFHYHEASRIVAGGTLQGTDVAVLTAIALGAFAVAHMAYARRDL